METAATKALIHKVLAEGFDECVKDWNLTELEHKNLFAGMAGPDIIDRIFNVAQVSQAYSDEGKILIHATLKGITIPADGKPIKLALELGNTHDRRMKLANIGYPIVDIFALPDGAVVPTTDQDSHDAEQLDIEDYADEMEDGGDE
jgi:hypothetical protein